MSTNNNLQCVFQMNNLTVFSLCGIKYIQPKKREVKMGTNRFASISYTIADVFGTLKGLLSCSTFKNQLQQIVKEGKAYRLVSLLTPPLFWLYI